MKNVLRSLAVASLLVSSAAYAGSGKGLAVDAAVKTGQGGLVGSVLGNTRVNANAALGGKSGLKVDVNTKGKGGLVGGLLGGGGGHGCGCN